jgi:hypothetical protein
LTVSALAKEGRAPWLLAECAMQEAEQALQEERQRRGQ